MKILIKVANKKNLETLYRIRNYFIDKNNKYSNKTAIFSKFANLIDFAIDKIYRREKISFDDKLITDNSQFTKSDNSTYLVPTRNLLFLNRYSGFKKSKEIVNLLEEMDNIYQKIINRICLLAYSLEINNPLDLMALYYVLCDYSFLSYNILDSEDCMVQMEKYTKESLGFNILLGHGVCRHHAVFFRDLCLRYGYDAKVILAEVVENEETQYYGHAFTSVLFEGMTLYLDAYNGLSFDYDQNNHLVDPFKKNNYFKKDKLLFRYKASLLGMYQIPSFKKTTIDFNNFKYLFRKAVDYFESDEVYEKLKGFAVENYYFLEKMDMLAQKLQYEIILNNQKQLKKTRI